jgi:hypothetical protein
MDIKPKPPGTGRPAFDPSENTRSVELKTGKFENKLPGATESPALSAAVKELKGLYSKRDLDDSAKLDSVLNTAARKLMLDELPQAAQLGESDKKFLADWMAKDPVIQGKLMGFLRRILD